MKRTFILSCSRDGRYSSGFVKGLMTVVASGHPAMAGFTDSQHESDIARARGRLLTHALRKTDAEGFLFIDDDIHWEVKDFDAIVAAGTVGCDVVGGLYAKRRAAGGLVFNGPLGREHADCRDLVVVQHVGAGFLWMARAIVETMQTHAIEIEGERGTWFHFFPAGVYGPKNEAAYLSEDYAFCNLVRAAGGQVWLHRGIRLGHEGKEIFRVSF